MRSSSRELERIPDGSPRNSSHLVHTPRNPPFPRWVAPFVASASSDILREHPEWFVRGSVNAQMSVQMSVGPSARVPYPFAEKLPR